MEWMKVLSGPSHNSDGVIKVRVIFPDGTYYPQVHPQAVENMQPAI
jgi:hypothetical protein